MQIAAEEALLKGCANHNTKSGAMTATATVVLLSSLNDSRYRAAVKVVAGSANATRHTRRLAANKVVADSHGSFARRGCVNVNVSWDLH